MGAGFNAIAYTQTTCSTGAMPIPPSSAASITDEPCSHTWQAFTHTQPHKPGNKDWTIAKSPSTASPRPEAHRLFQAKLWCGTVHPGPNRTLLSTSKYCLMTRICWLSTSPADCQPSPAAASWKTHSCGWCKSKPPTQTLSTGWAEPLPASSSSPKQRRQPLSFPQTGTHPEFKKSTERWLQDVAQHDAYEILTPIGLVPHPLIGSVWAASPSGKPSKSLAKVISRTANTTTFEVSLNSGRAHQIRIHLASIGHPLVGDPLYGLSGLPLENLPGLPGDGGYFLHARFLKFHHPITGEPINLEAALPSGFALHQ